jgi:hypothetical protein
MKKVIKLTESDLIKIIKSKLNEEESETIEIPASEYKQLLSVTGNNGAILEKTRRFRGKKIVVKGTLDIIGLPVKNLGTIHIDGNLNAHGSSLETLKGVTIKGWSSYFSTPLDNAERARQRRMEELEADGRRENGEWDRDNPNIDEIGLKANAAFDYLVQNGEIAAMDEEEKQELKDKQEELDSLEQQQQDYDTSNDDWQEVWDELQGRIVELQEEIDDLTIKNNDVYGLIPEKYGHYDMTSFKTTYDNISEYKIAVGTTSEADTSLKDWVKGLLDDEGYRGFNTSTVENYIDGDEVADYLTDDLREQIYEDPENWDISRELSKSQEEEIWVLKMEKWVYENEGIRFPIKYPTREDNGKIFDFMDEDEEYEFQLRYEGDEWVLYKDGVVTQPGEIYDDEDTEDHQDDRDSRIVDIEYEIQEIEENPDGDLNEDDIENVVDDRRREISRNPLEWIRDYGLTMDNFIDEGQFIEDVANDEDYGTLNSYDNSYDSITVGGTDYIVMAYEK